MDIGRADSVHGPGRIEPNRIQPTRPPEAPAAPIVDRVDLVETAKLVSEASSLPALRLERVAEFKRLIESGQYTTEERLVGALQRFLQENDDLRA